MKLKMKNPWEEIPLSDYESHMKLDSVMQLQAMNEMMKGQFHAYPVSSIMILGIAGGNGLEHAQTDKFEKILSTVGNPKIPRIERASGMPVHGFEI